MANLKEIRRRIASVKNTRQVTSAMKMVSAAKLRKAQDAIIQLRPYTMELSNLAQKIVAAAGSQVESPLIKKRDVKSVLIVLLTSNKGLCGAFNYQITKEAILFAKNKFPDLIAQGEVKFLTIGRKGDEIIRREGFPIYKRLDELIDDKSFAASSTLAKELMKIYETQQFDQINLLYNGFKNAAVQQVTNNQYLPIRLESNEQQEFGDDAYIFEPNATEIITDLLPRILEITFHSAILDSIAAEQGARMTAMHKATDNATELIKELTLNYNKARQAAITNEITEIVSGANALGK